MSRYHVCNFDKRSGIAKYGRDFNELVLRPAGYEPVSPRQVMSLQRQSRLKPEDVFHIELGAMQFEERDAMLHLMAAGHRRIDATIHDPPFLTFPLKSFESPFLNRLSRGFDFYLGGLGGQRRVLRRLRRAFVLTDKGEQALLERGATHVVRIPHLVLPSAVWTNSDCASQDILYFGFVGRNKGIDYALELHSRIRARKASIRMHVIGEAMGTADQAYFRGLQERYQVGVMYHGYVDEHRLDDLFAQARHVFLPFNQYKYFQPASGSVINALKRGRVVWASAVNTVPELIEHRRNGMLLTRDIESDARAFLELADDNQALRGMGDAALSTARQMAQYPFHQHFPNEY